MAKLNLIRDEKGLWLDGFEWPESFRAEGSLLAPWRKADTDLIDIKLLNGRGIYRVTSFNRITGMFQLELVYEELDLAPRDVVK